MYMSGLDQKYEFGDHKITTHRFRVFFITNVSCHDPNLAKYFTIQKKQSKDLLMYDRLAIDEMLENYIKFESDLLICDSDKHKGNVN